MLAGFIVVGLIARIAFWAITDRKLDDALITIKFDKNLADGFGLIHNFGEGHVQGFTSALSVLVPMPGELIWHGGGLFLIRLVSLACFALAAVYAYRIANESGLGRWPTGFVLAFLALDQNQVFFGVAGMETQIAVAVLLAGFYYVLVEDYPKSGVALGLALLARPDFVLWVAPAYVFLVIRNFREALRAGGNLRRDRPPLGDLHLGVLRVADPEHDHREGQCVRPGLPLGHPPRRLDQLRGRPAQRRRPRPCLEHIRAVL